MYLQNLNNPNNHLNFSGGPGALPESVLNATQAAIINVPEVGLSLLGISHRSDWLRNVLDETEENLRNLLSISGQLFGSHSMYFCSASANLIK